MHQEKFKTGPTRIDHQVRGDGGLGEARGGEDGEEEMSARDASERNSEERVEGEKGDVFIR